MASPKWAAMTGPMGSMAIPGNDSKHNLTDQNSGGGPSGRKASIPPARRGGTGHNGRDISPRVSMGGGRSGSGNPASRGGASIGSMRPNASIPGHGGSPQKRNNIPAPRGGGFGQHGQNGVPSYSHSQPKPGAGNVAGRSYKLIAGRFKRAAMGAQANSGSSGKYGSAPVTQNT